MEGFTITTITAFVAVDEQREEGVMAFLSGGTYMPLVCADEARIASMFPIAEQIARTSGKQYRIVQFSGRVDVTEEITKKYKK